MPDETQPIPPESQPAPLDPTPPADVPNNAIVAPTYDTLLGTETFPEPTVTAPEYRAFDNEKPESKD